MKLFGSRLFCLLFLIASVICFDSCNEDNTPVFSAFSNIHDIAGAHQSGDRLKIEIFARADKGELHQITLSSFDAQYGTRVCLDTTVSVQTINLTYEYQVPFFNQDSVQQELQLTVVNDHGDKSCHSVSFVACGGSRGLMNEYAGLLLYGGKSKNPNALDLRSPSQTFNLSMADTSIVDVDIFAYDNADDDSMALSHEWRTMTDVEFVRFNDFDYVNANPLSLESLYNSSRRSNYVKDIKQGDIILVGKSNQVWGVFMVALCYDQEGVDQDGYLLNYKCLDR